MYLHKVLKTTLCVSVFVCVSFLGVQLVLCLDAPHRTQPTQPRPTVSLEFVSQSFFPVSRAEVEPLSERRSLGISVVRRSCSRCKGEACEVTAAEAGRERGPERSSHLGSVMGTLNSLRLKKTACHQLHWWQAAS